METGGLDQAEMRTWPRAMSLPTLDALDLEVAEGNAENTWPIDRVSR